VAKNKEKWINCLLLVLCLGIYWALDLSCPVRTLLQIPCPGCGMTRALKCLLQGDLAGSFAMHPMLLSTPVLLLYYLKDGRLFANKWLNYGILAAIGLGFLIHWIMQLPG
jgi:hypothetical protein